MTTINDTIFFLSFGKSTFTVNARNLQPKNLYKVFRHWAASTYHNVCLMSNVRCVDYKKVVEVALTKLSTSSYRHAVIFKMQAVFELLQYTKTNILDFYLTRISGRYAPLILAPAEGSSLEPCTKII